MKGRRPGVGDLLGSLLRSTVQQMGVVKDVVERQAREQRTRLDAVLLGRKRKDALAELGRVVHELALAGDLGDLAEDPEVARALADVDAIAAELDAVEERRRDGGAGGRREEGTRRGGWPRRREGAAPRAGYDEAAADAEADDVDDDVEEVGEVEGAAAAPDPSRGGIRFGAQDPDDGDDDLEEYMHPDDVPRRPPPTGEEK